MLEIPPALVSGNRGYDPTLRNALCFEAYKVEFGGRHRGFGQPVDDGTWRRPFSKDPNATEAVARCSRGFTEDVSL
jgi:hypothetical protein